MTRIVTKKSAKEGMKIIQRIKDRSVNPGGNGVEFVGASGVGKTSLFFNFIEDFASNDNELMFWRESMDTPIQFVKFPRFEIFVEEGLNLKIVDQNNGGQALDFPYKKFESVPQISYKVELENDPDPEALEENQRNKGRQDEIFESICKRADPGKLNVIFFNRRFTWIDFIRYLKEVPHWHDVFIDEYEDVFPFSNRGEEWHRIDWAKKNLKQIRKGLVNLFCNTQSKSDVDWRVRKKMTIWGYMPGGVPDKDSPIKKEAVRSLDVGKVYLDWKRSNYGKIDFLPRHANKDVFYVAKRGSET